MPPFIKTIQQLSKLAWFGLFALFLLVSFFGLGIMLDDSRYDSSTTATVKQIKKPTTDLIEASFIVTITYSVSNQNYETTKPTEINYRIGEEVTIQYKSASPDESKITAGAGYRVLRNAFVYLGFILSFASLLFMFRTPSKKRKSQTMDSVMGQWPQPND